MSAIRSKFELTETQKGSLARNKERLLATAKAIASQPIALIGFGLLVFFVFLAVAAPLIAPYDPSRHFVMDTGLPVSLEPPSSQHLFGTTHDGRDVFSQWVYGSRVSVMVGLLSGFVVMVIGTSVGVIAGYYKGTVDLVIMRIVDMLFGIPATPLVIVLAMLWGASVWNILIAMALVLWRTMARVIRSETLSLAERPFVKSARAAGASDFRIIVYHIIPNLVPLMLIETTIVVGAAIIIEAGVSFLGLGAVNMISWGSMLQLTFATGAIREAWWWMLPPGLSITLMVLSFFYISRAIEEVVNPDLESGGVR